MHSRAFLLLSRDLINLERFPLTGIAAEPQKDDLFNWNAKIEGLEGTAWEGGIFQVHLSFSEDFNYKLPEIHFMTIPFHPNVDARDGTPVLPRGNWGEESTVSTLLLSLQALLSNPELDGGCIRNPAAAKLLMEAPLTYKQMALDCVAASLRVDAGLTPYDMLTESGGRSPMTPDAASRERSIQVKPVSFDDYHTLWRGIATSITGYRKPNDFLNLLENDVHLNHVHCKADQMVGWRPDQKQPIETTSLEQRVTEHILLMYGKPGSKQPSSSVPQSKSRSQRIEQLKQMYRKGMGVEGDEPTEPGDKGRESRDLPEAPDEVEKLLEWTNTLDEQTINQTSPL